MRTVFSTAVACLSVVGLSVAAEVQASVKKETSIPAGGLGPALHALAAERPVHIVFISEDVQEARTRGASGSLTTDEALSQLLDGTGLTYRYIDDETVSILPVAQMPAAAGAGRASHAASGQSGARPGVRRKVRTLSTIGIATLGGMSLAASQQAGAQAAQEVAPLEEIVVTAQKREESLHEVPSSISVVTGDMLQMRGATQLSDYAGYIPGFTQLSAAPGRNQIILRGITSGVSDSATVGTYIDDAPFGSSTSNAAAGTLGLDLLPYDLERVEVLRGPQGTLYGASTLGGLLKYVTRQPDPGDWSMDTGGEMTSFAASDDLGWSARLSVNAPIAVDRTALRGSFYSSREAGYIDNLAQSHDENVVDKQGGRLSLLWAPAEHVQVQFSALRQDLDVEGSSTIPASRTTGAAVYGERTTSYALPQESNQRIGFYTATLQWDLTWAELVSATSYSTLDVEGVSDSSASLGSLFGGASVPISTTVELDKATQEIRLASPGEQRVEWLIGAFYTEEESSFGQTGFAYTAPGGSLIPGLNPLIDAVLPADYQEFSLFGDATYRFTDRFDVTAGLRWSTSEQSFEARTSGLLFNPLDPTFTTGESGRSSEDVLTYMLSSRLHVGQDTMLYGRIASGYRPGGPNVALPGTPAQFEADELVNYELGVKSQFMEGRASLEVAAFYIDWSDIQIHLSAGNLGYYDNAGEAVSQGVEFTFGVTPVSGLRLGFNAAYTDATLSGDVPALRAREGDRVPTVARWTASATADYELWIVNDWRALVGAGYRYTGARDSVFPSNPANFHLGSHDLVDLYAGVSSSRYSIRLYAKNVLDEHAPLTTGASAGPGRVQVGFTRPRLIGLSADVHF